jgi:hypothetical protein
MIFTHFIKAELIELRLWHPQNDHAPSRSHLPELELELELIQTKITQKPMLRGEVLARALRASSLYTYIPILNHQAGCRRFKKHGISSRIT